MQRILVKADCHLDGTLELHPSYLLLKKFVRDFEPDVVVDLGDLLDLPYIAKFNRENIKILSGKWFQTDYDLANRELDFWQQHCKKYYQVEGNHDERIERLLEKSPMWRGMIEYENALGLKKRKIPFYKQTDEPLRIGKLSFVHGYWSTKYTAQKLLDTYFHNVVGAHIHRFDMAAKVLPIHREQIQSWCIGCLTDTRPDWMKGRPTRWQHGFAVVYMDGNGCFNFYPVNIIDNAFMFEGKKWRL